MIFLIGGSRGRIDFNSNPSVRLNSSPKDHKTYLGGPLIQYAAFYDLNTIRPGLFRAARSASRWPSRSTERAKKGGRHFHIDGLIGGDRRTTFKMMLQSGCFRPSLYTAGPLASLSGTMLKLVCSLLFLVLRLSVPLLPIPTEPFSRKWKLQPPVSV